MHTKVGIGTPSRESSSANGTRRADFLAVSALNACAAESASPSNGLACGPDRRELEEQVGTIWRELLKVSSIKLDANFFDLGGQSVDAARMLVRLERSLGLKVDIAVLFRAPTLGAFLREIVGEGPAPDEPAPARAPASRAGAAASDRVVVIRRTGSQAPVFVLNNTAVLFPLARALGDDRPLYALQLCPSATPVELPSRDFRDLARDVVELIRSARPSGPYVLVGLCVFGALAFEAAQQLRDAGEVVELVVLNDTWAPGHIESLPKDRRRTRAMLKRAHNVSADIGRVFAGEQSVSGFLAGFSLLRRFGFVAAATRAGLMDPDAVESMMRAENRWYTDYLLAARQRYRPQPYGGDVLVFRCEETLSGRYFADDLGWRPLVRGRLHVMDCPGMHAEMYLQAGSEVMARGFQVMLGDG